jgi:hypothetical protein
MYTKAQLIEMNNSTMGRNWIINIGDEGPYKIYPTWDAGLMSGRIYIALPATLEITASVRTKYNLM